LRLNIRLKGYAFTDNIYTSLGRGMVLHFYYKIAAAGFNIKNFVADFIRQTLNLIHKNDQFVLEPPFGELGVTYALHL